MTGAVPHATKVRTLHGRHVRLTFGDGSAADLDLKPLLHGAAFEPVRDDDAVFRRVRVDEFGGLEWPNGADIAPEVLRNAVRTKARPTQR